MTVISDYGHHPTEVRATIRAVKSGWEADLNRLHVVFQPHRFSRTKECFVDFLTGKEPESVERIGAFKSLGLSVEPHLSH